MGIIFPAVDFPLYGLSGSWRGSRWLDFVEGQSDGHTGQPARGIWLGHGSGLPGHATQPWVRVGSLPRHRHAEAMTRPGGDSVREVAFAALFALVNLTLPAPEARPDGEDQVHGLVARADAEADRYADWASVTWEVDGQAVTGRVHDQAGAWAGFTTELPETDVVVVACGVPPGSLVLTRVEDGAGYHVDLGRPLEFPETIQRSMGR